MGRFVLESTVLVALVHEFVSLFHKTNISRRKQNKRKHRDLRNFASIIIIHRRPVYRCYCLVNALYLAFISMRDIPSTTGVIRRNFLVTLKIDSFFFFFTLEVLRSRNTSYHIESIGLD